MPNRPFPHAVSILKISAFPKIPASPKQIAEPIDERHCTDRRHRARSHGPQPRPHLRPQRIRGRGAQPDDREDGRAGRHREDQWQDTPTRESPLPPTVRDSLLTYAEKREWTRTGTYCNPHTTIPALGSLNYAVPVVVSKEKGWHHPKAQPVFTATLLASNCLSKDVPITDVAEWMGHSNINMTFRIYRHLMPASAGRAARLLNEGL